MDKINFHQMHILHYSRVDIIFTSAS